MVYCFHVSAISDAFLQDTLTLPHLSCGIRWPKSSKRVQKRELSDEKYAKMYATFDTLTFELNEHKKTKN
jgi:hypothetical protein